MFPSTWSSALMIVGAIWVVQGLGVIDSGSFMDGEPLWAVLGGAMIAAGLLLFVVERRRRRKQTASQTET